ncbi:MAG: stage III sporulation protein AE [Oscillospiraceae bacterium]|nr:stage III sporulation protein AE [Oscillospiraceae bacterium]
MKILLMILLALLVMALSGYAYEDTVPQDIVDAVGVEDIVHALPGEAADLMHGMTPYNARNWQATFNNLIGQAGREAGGALRTALLGLLVIVAILLICGMVDGLREGEDVNGHDFVQTGGALAIGVTALMQVNGLLQLGSRMIEQLTTFSNVLIPTMTTVAIVSGQPGAALAKQSAAVLFGGILMNVIQGVLIPLLYGYIALSVAHAAVGHDTLGKIAQLLKWIASRLLIILMTLYTLFLSLSGVLAGATDNLALRGTKAAINVVPVVGGIISGAADSVMAGATLVRASIGVFGLLAMVALVLTPFIQMSMSYLVFKVGAAVAPVMSRSKLNTLVADIGAAFGLLLGMVGAAFFINFISVLALMMGVRL